MATYTCARCRGEVAIETRFLGPWACRGLLPPVDILCPECVASAHIELHIEAVTWALVDGREWRGFDGALARSRNPAVARIYHRDAGFAPTKDGE